MHGAWIPVAARIEQVDSMSAHADANEIMGWLGGFTAPPTQTFIVHGEPAAQDTLGARIKAELGWAWKAPDHGVKIEL